MTDSEAGPGGLQQLEPWARALAAGARVGHLALLDDRGHPRVQPVTFAILGDDVWSAIDDKPKRRQGRELARVRWSSAHPESALTIDHYDDDWTQLAWVQILGRTAIIDVVGHEHAVHALAARYPQYRDRQPAGPLLRLTAERTVCWRATPA